MSTTSVSSSTSTSSTSSTTSSSSLANSSTNSAYNTFLTLLTTQLKNQNPLDATDPNQFTAELISLASLQQQQAISDKLDTISTDTTAMSLSSGVGLIGKTVTADNSTATLSDGSATWNYTLSSAAATVNLVISDSSGNTVATESGALTSGSHSYTWDGTGTNGATYSSGTYTLSITATDSSGNAVTASTATSGTVTAVDSSSGTIELTVGSTTIPLSKVTSVTSAS